MTIRLDSQPPPHIAAPFSFARYLGLRDCPRTIARHGDGCAQNQQVEQAERDPHVILGMLRDPSNLEMSISNHDDYVACQTFRGVRKVGLSFTSGFTSGQLGLRK